MICAFRNDDGTSQDQISERNNDTTSEMHEEIDTERDGNEGREKSDQQKTVSVKDAETDKPKTSAALIFPRTRRSNIGQC